MAAPSTASSIGGMSEDDICQIGCKKPSHIQTDQNQNRVDHSEKLRHLTLPLLGLIEGVTNRNNPGSRSSFSKLISRTDTLATHTIPDHSNGEEFVTENTEMQMSHVKVEHHQCRLNMDNDTNRDGLVSKDSFSKLQYRFSSVHNAAKTAHLPRP